MKRSRSSRKFKLDAASMRWAFVLVCSCASLSALSCNDEAPPPQPARFNRPNRVDFVCVNGTQVVAREQCVSGNANGALSPHALVTQAGRGEIAVVNLATRQVIDSRRDIPGYTFIPVGETPTAIVVPPVHAQHTYVANYGSRDVRVLRTRALIATVTEQPDAQRVALTSEDGTALLAPSDMVLAPDESALFVAAPDAHTVLRLPIQRCTADSGPDCEDGLIDEAGIDRIQLPEVPTLRAVEPMTPAVYEELCGFPRTPLPAPVPIDPAKLDPALRDAPARPSALALDAFCLQGESCLQRLLVADTAQPVIHAIDIDAWARGEPGQGVLESIVTGVPTKDVVVTPRVPRAPDPASVEETQYIYAIDAGDGSVLVIEDGQVLNVNGNPGQRGDRLLFDGGSEGALALEVMTPGFALDQPANQYVESPIDPLPQPGNPLACTDLEHEEQKPSRLRGVFLAAALTDGTIRVFDVHDMELRSSNGEEACRACAQNAVDPKLAPESRKIPLLVRNQQRLAASFIPVEGEPLPTFVPAAAVTFGVDGVTFGVRPDGTTASPRAPGLECIACAETLTRAYPVDEEVSAPTQPMAGDAGTTDAGATDAATDGATDAGAIDGAADAGAPDSGLPVEPAEACSGAKSALLCVSNDPWSSGQDRWNAVFEGVLPTSVENRGHFVPNGPETGGLELETDSDPCRAGVLGSEDMQPDYPEDCAARNDPTGDQVVLTSRPLDRDNLALIDRDDEDTLQLCAALESELRDNPRFRVAFEIRRAYEDRLVVREAMVRSIGDAKRFADIRPCYPETISFAVHTRDAFTVWGAQSGFQHRVRANTAHRCVIDPDPALALRSGRARPGCEFRNSSLQFKLAEPPGDAQLAGVELITSFNSRAIKLVMRAYDLGFGSASVVTEQLRYSDVEGGALYMVDINDRGLLPIPLDPFPSALSSGAQFN
jgi:hypothetical protein